MNINKFLLILVLLFTIPASYSANFLQDDFATNSLKNAKPSYKHTEYNYENTDKVPIKLVISEKIKSEQDLYEGQIVEFKLIRHLIYNNKIIAKRGAIVHATVKMIITSGMNGIPASIIFENFQVPNTQPHQITEMYEVYGQDRSLIVFPLKWALTFLPPTGSLTNFIKGGHAKLKPKKVITLYYHPNWI